MLKRINIYVDDDLWHTFRMQCLAQRRSASKGVAELIEQALAAQVEDPLPAYPPPRYDSDEQMAQSD
jgi:hypothetical protein